jgi:transcriptional regulator of heat shock response
MESITDRQREILMAIIKEFMESADEIGSLSLLEKYDLGVSSATIRNEMAHLMDMGLLEKSHISSGRHPTDQALRLYVTKIVGGSRLNPVVAVQIRQGIFRERFSRDSIVKSILRILADKGEGVAFIVFNEDTRYYGLTNLFKYEELCNIEDLERIVELLEDDNFMMQMLSQFNNSGVALLIGEETGVKGLNECSIAFTRIKLPQSDNGYVGILSSKRMNYENVVPALKEIQEATKESLKGWY